MRKFRFKSKYNDSIGSDIFDTNSSTLAEDMCRQRCCVVNTSLDIGQLPVLYMNQSGLAEDSSRDIFISIDFPHHKEVLISEHGKPGQTKSVFIFEQSTLEDLNTYLRASLSLHGARLLKVYDEIHRDTITAQISLICQRDLDFCIVSQTIGNYL